MSAVFISYRRQAALVHARALFERLSREFGPSRVFIDLDGIEIGMDFVSLIDEQLEGCHVMLALIDPGWADARDRKGERRLDQTGDFVRLEIATALRRGIPVAPILLDGAEMPDAGTLPEDLQGLARRHAMELDFRRFDAEVTRLVTMIRRILEPVGSPTALPSTATLPAAAVHGAAPVTPLASRPPTGAVTPALGFTFADVKGLVLGQRGGSAGRALAAVFWLVVAYWVIYFIEDEWIDGFWSALGFASY